MATEAGQQKYKQRAKREWSNAQCRNRGLQLFVVRGLAKVKIRMVALRAQRASAAA